VGVNVGGRGYEHDSWASWMNWLYQNGTWGDDGSFTIKPEKAKRWFDLSITRYEELDEPTKQFDRDEVKKLEPILQMCLRECRPERVDKFQLVDPYDNPDNLEGFNNAIDAFEEKAEQLLGEKLGG
jgi:arsenate reductase-like glutaredoxin family protein